MLLSKNLICLSSWAVTVTGNVGWHTIQFICFPNGLASNKEKIYQLKYAVYKCEIQLNVSYNNIQQDFLTKGLVNIIKAKIKKC